MTVEQDEESRQDQLNDVRRAVADAMTFIQSREAAQAAVEMTFEGHLARAIDEIERDISDIRPGRLSRLSSLRDQVNTAIDQALQLPASVFGLPEEDDEGSEDS